MIKSNLKLKILADQVHKLDRLRSTDIQMSNTLVQSQSVASIYLDMQRSGVNFSISFEGVSSETDAHEMLRKNALSGSKEKYEVDLSYMRITGNFVISDYKINAAHNNFENFAVTMQSAGEIDIEVNDYDL